MNKKRLLDLFNQKKAVIGVLMGGFSSEREISLRSGKAVSAALKLLGHRIKDIDVKSRNIFNHSKPDFDIAFIALHGKFGEDGGIQKLLKSHKIIYTGSGAEASKRAMDKFATKEAFVKDKIPTAEYTTIANGQKQNYKIPFGYPVVVKPRSEGSSVGVSIVKNFRELLKAIKEAFKYDKNVLIEKFIPGREVTVGILGKKALPVIELKPKQSFYNYKAKYQDTRTEYIVNPKFPAKIIKEMQKNALKAHKALGCSGISRIDLIYAPKIGAIVLEANSIPGLTDRSLLPKAASAIGIEFPKLCEIIIREALK
jgi:D-alanine-D-alanine ligase